MNNEIEVQSDHDPAVRSIGGHRVLSVNELLGRTVVAEDGQEVGTIGELYVDVADEPTLHAVVDVGGFLGVGAKPVLVHFSNAVMLGTQLQIAMSAQALEEAPEFHERMS